MSDDNRNDADSPVNDQGRREHEEEEEEEIVVEVEASSDVSASENVEKEDSDEQVTNGEDTHDVTENSPAHNGTKHMELFKKLETVKEIK